MNEGSTNRVAVAAAAATAATAAAAGSEEKELLPMCPLNLELIRYASQTLGTRFFPPPDTHES